MPRKFELITDGPLETEKLGARLAGILRPGDVVLLVGELGTGKTCLVRGIAGALGIEEPVQSPTFTLLRDYHGRIPLYHLDAYRLEGPRDLFSLGVEEYVEGEGILVMEWGDRAGDFFDVFLEVRLEFGKGENERRVHLLPRGGDWVERLEEAFAGEGRGTGTVGADTHGLSPPRGGRGKGSRKGVCGERKGKQEAGGFKGFTE